MVENAKRLIRLNLERKESTPVPIPVRVHISPSSSDDDNPISNPRTSFIVYDNTIIPFGKMKGRPHSDLLKPENKAYAIWLINQDKQGKFYYRSTVKYLKEKLQVETNYDCTSNDYLYLINLQNPSEQEQKRIQFFENNLASHFVKLK